MSTEKLSELSKPVAYDYQIASACIADGDDKKWVDWSNKLTHECPPDWMVEDGKVTGIKPLYSQEYVSALKHESAVNWEAAASLNVENQGLKKRIAELERARFIAWPGAMFAPVLARIKVDVKRRDGSVSVGQSAGNVVWYHSDSPSDVVAFALAVEGDE